MSNVTQASYTEQHSTNRDVSDVSLLRLIMTLLVVAAIIMACSGLIALALMGYKTYAIHLGASSFIISILTLFKNNDKKTQI
jgi:ABC-type long-subunit fatty acid transport system fused permease/ATPase subunit